MYLFYLIKDGIVNKIMTGHFGIKNIRTRFPYEREDIHKLDSINFSVLVKGFKVISFYFGILEFKISEKAVFIFHSTYTQAGKGMNQQFSGYG